MAVAAKPACPADRPVVSRRRAPGHFRYPLLRNLQIRKTTRPLPPPSSARAMCCLPRRVTIQTTGFFRGLSSIRPLGLFADAARGTGLAMVEPDPDGVVRHFQMQLEGETTLPASAIQAMGNPFAARVFRPDKIRGACQEYRHAFLLSDTR